MHRADRHILAALILLAPSLAAQPRGLRFTHISQDDGLSQSTVNAIAQDGQGFLWFGTQDGLNRYDGYSVSVFRHSALDTSSISDNAVWSLARDRRGDVWIGTMRGGLNRYDVTTGRFSSFRHDPADRWSLPEDNVTAVFEDSRGWIWAGTMTSGVCRLDPATGRFHRYASVPEDPATISDNTVWGVTEDQRGTIWLATWGGVSEVRPDGRDSTRIAAVRHLPLPGDPQSLPGMNIRTVLADREGGLWVGTWGGGLAYRAPGAKGFRTFRHMPGEPGSVSSDRILSLHQDPNGDLWVGTGDAGLDLLRRGSDTFVHHRSDPKRPGSLSNDIICSAISDRSGALWIGTGAGGVHMTDARLNRFPHHRDDGDDPSDMNGNDVWAILEDRGGDLWVGTYGDGLNRIDRRSGKALQYTHDPRSPRSLSHNNVLALCQTRSGDLWVGTEGGGANLLRAAADGFERFITIPGNDNSLAQNEVTCILEDRRGDIWFGTNSDRLDRYTPATGRFVHYLLGGPDSTGPAGTAVMALHEARNGDVWVGTLSGGLARYDAARDRFVLYRYDPAGADGLNNSTVLSIHEDRDGRVWLGTYGGGLNMLDPSGGTWRHVTESDGLPNNVVYGILPDRRGRLWLTTNKGLARFDPAGGGVRTFDARDGLQGNEFNQGSHAIGRNGEMFVGGINGFNAFHPDSVRDNQDVPPVYITSFRVFDRPVPLPRAVPALQQVTLPHDRNFFSVEFVALNFAAPEKNRYAYMLEGLDPGWIDAGTRRYASYTNLDPGDYTLRVRGSNNDGIWNDQGASLAITIVPPYWRTWWFRLLAAAATAALLFLMYRYRVRKLLEIERLRTSIATDLHDDIGSTLTEIALVSDVGRREVDSALSTGRLDAPGAQRLSSILEDIGGTSRGLIDAMNDIVWAVDPKNDSFDVLLLRMKNHAARVLEAKGINYEIDIPSELSALGLPLAFRRRLFLIFKEAVNNILRHARPARVFLTMEREGGNLVMTVSDDGVGFDPESVARGNGLRNMEERAASLGGSLSIASSRAAGTAITLRVPIP